MRICAFSNCQNKVLKSNLAGLFASGANYQRVWSAVTDASQIPSMPQKHFKFETAPLLIIPDSNHWSFMW